MPEKRAINAVFQHATEGILIVRRDGEILQANPSAERLFGYEPKELLGQKIEVLIPRRYSSDHDKHREGYAKEPHPRSMGMGVELYGLKKDGSEFPAEISLSPYETEGEYFTIAFVIDISLRKNAEEKLRNYSGELERQVKNRTLILEEAIAELEKTKEGLNNSLSKEKELNEMKSRFVSMASHEFRTPLATIQSSLALVKKYGEIGEIEKQDRHIGKIKSSITNLTDILNDFLSVSKLEEGRVELSPEKIDLPVFVHEVINELRTICKEGQKINLKHIGESVVTIDKKLIKNILFNLISNAIKFSDEGSVVHVTTKIENGEIVIRIQDAGMGISKADQKHLFSRFFRGENATNIPGTGLGLNIVGKYVEMLNGKVDFNSELEKGTTFIVTLPLTN